MEGIKSGDIVPTSLKRMESELKKVSKECDEAQKKYDAFADKFSNAEMDLSFANSSGDATRISEAQGTLANLEKESLIAADNLSNLQNKASSLENSINQIKMDPRTSQEAIDLTNKLSLMESKMQTSTDKANRLKDELNQTFNQDGNILNRLDGIKSKLDSLGGKLKSSVSDQISNLNKQVSHFGKRISGLIASALVFNILSNGLRNLASGFGNLLKSNSQFSSSLNQIKVNLLTAFAPIYNYVLPAINALMSALSRITGAIAGFVSGLFGKTAEQSKKNASALYKQAKAYEKAGKSAKKAEGNLASFDKLEVIGDKGDSSGGGGQDIDFSGQIEQSGKLLDFLNKVKELMAQIFEPFKKAWDTTGMLVVNSLKNAFIGVKSLISSVLGSLFEVWTNGTGQTIIENILTRVSLVLDIIGGISQALSKAWNNAGNGTAIIQDIANIFIAMQNITNSIYENIKKWVLSPGFQEALNVVVQIVKDILDWCSQIANWIVQMYDTYLSPVVDKILNCISKIIVAIGSVWNFLKPIIDQTIKNLKTTLEPAIKMISNTIGGIIDALSGVMDFITGVFTGDWEKAWNGIKEFFNGIIDALISIFTGLVDIIISQFKIAIDNVKTVWSSIGTWFKDVVWGGIKNAFSNVTNWFKDTFSRAWQAVKNVFSTGGKIFDGIKEGIANVFRTVVNGIIGGINKVIAVPFKSINGMLNKIRNVDILGVSPFKNFWKQNPLTVPKIPMLAQGAVIPPNAKFLAMLGDQKNGRNLEAPESLIRKIVREESGNSNKEFILNLKAILECDKKQFGQLSFDGIRLKEQQNGKKYFLN